jgi:hypothetical protein
MFGVSDCITNNTFKEDFENTTSLLLTSLISCKYFFVDKTGDTFDSTTTSETANGRFGNSLYPTSVLSEENPRFHKRFHE